MRSQLERAINLAAKTGDKIIVVDELNDRSSVVMNLDEYEGLLNGENKTNVCIENLTEEELLDKINRDIVTWREANKDKTFLEEIDDLGDNVENEFTENIEEDEPVLTEIMPDEKEMVPEIAVEEKDAAEEDDSADDKKETEENLYYYNEPTSAETVSVETESEKEESGFTSIKDELKRNKKAWAIPEEAKKFAEDVKI